MSVVVSDAAATVAAVAAGLAGTLYLGRKTVRFLRALDKLSKLVEHELTNNSGASMKDELHAVAVAVGVLQSDVQRNSHRLETLEALTILGYKSPEHEEGKPQ